MSDKAEGESGENTAAAQGDEGADAEEQAANEPEAPAADEGAAEASAEAGDEAKESAASETKDTASSGEAQEADQEAKASEDQEASGGDEAGAAKEETAPMSDPEATVEVEPEEVVLQPVPRAKQGSHHPPPPPSLRAASASHTDRPIAIVGEPKLARDLMTKKLFTVEPNDPIGGLERHMDQFHFRNLPVVEGEKLVGLISLTDLMHALSSFLSERAKERDALINKTPAKRVMRSDVVTVAPDTPLKDVTRIMWRTRARCVPVVDDNDKLVGIITEGDFVKLAHAFLSREA